MKWYVVPKYAPPRQENPLPDADVYNRRGEFVATFDNIEDAERAVDEHNSNVTHLRTPFYWSVPCKFGDEQC